LFAFNQVGAWLAAKSRNQINNLAVARTAENRRMGLPKNCIRRTLHRAITAPAPLGSCGTENRRHRHHLVIVIIAMGFPRFVLSTKTLSHKNNNREQRNQKKIRKHKNQIALGAKATMKREKWMWLWRWGKWRKRRWGKGGGG